ncbi:MAG: hypothetical protein V1494_08335 [Candidatus Diapherotrites archaeon]
MPAIETVEKEKEKQRKPSQRRTVDKWKKKLWFTIFAPEEFERIELAETVAEKPENVMGRTIRLSVREIANQAKKSHISVIFKVAEVTGNKASTEAIGHEIKEGYMRRLIRRRGSKIEATQTVTLKDGKRAKVKTVVLAARKATGPQETAVRKMLEEEVAGHCAKIESKKIVEELVFGNLPLKIFNSIKKIVPIKRVEIVRSSIEKSK